MKKLLPIYFIYFLLSQNITAQTPHFRNYTVDDGLPSSLVYRAFQDSKGFIWFCTDKGLARFDGYKFEKFTTKNGLPNNDIWQCAEDSHQRIWFLSYANAFFYFDLKDGKFHTIMNPYEEYHDAHVWCYVEEPDGTMRVEISSRKATIYLDVNKSKIVKLKKAPYYDAWKINDYPLLNNISYRMLSKFHLKDSKNYSQWHLRAYSEGFQHNLLHKKHIIPDIKRTTNTFWNNAVSLIFDDDKTIYATRDSITYFKNNRFYSKHIRQFSKFSDDGLKLILSTGDINQKLIVTEQDIFVIDKDQNRNHKLDFIKDFQLNTLFIDSEKNTWLCTKDEGLFLLSNRAINSKTYSELTEQSLTSITKDGHGNVWFGAKSGNLFFYDVYGRINQQRFYPVFKTPVKKIIASHNTLGVLWEQSGFSIIDKNNKNIVLPTFKYIWTKGLLRNQRIYHKLSTSKIGIIVYGIKTAAFTSDSIIIWGSSSNLFQLKIYKGYYKIKRLIESTKILAVKQINNQVYAGTNKGVIKVDTNAIIDKTLESLKTKQAILTKPISCFESDNQNALWTGTDGYGIYRLLENKVTQIPELAGVIVNHLYFEKENNRLFVSTNEGIFVLKLTSKNTDLTYNIQRISLAQGLPTLEVNAVVVRNKELFVATSKGLAVLPLQNMNENNTKSIAMPLLIKNIKINRQDTTISQLYDLNYRQNNFDIDFVALSYKSDKNIKYDYKMLSSNDNSDTAWHSVQDLHKEFSLLSPGKYEFSLRAFDIDGNPSKAIEPIIFIINPPFWQMLWFKLLVGLTLFSLIISAFFIRTRNIKKKEQEKTEVNKKFAELELQALQAQMNPHFVFNALSAIQNFILNNNTEEATDYLSRFSRLMRLFLESSRNKYIALSDEKTLLDHYIKLEELRFKDKFSSEIIVHESVSLDTEIPSMLLQPFVENAINHGLVYKEKNDGLLKIEFSRIENRLICTIEDNGIGRAKAAEIKNKSLKPYKSRSTEITEERLRSLELIENTKIEILISDKVDKNDTPIGTKVTIVMYL